MIQNKRWRKPWRNASLAQQPALSPTPPGAGAKTGAKTTILWAGGSVVLGAIAWAILGWSGPTTASPRSLVPLAPEQPQTGGPVQVAVSPSGLAQHLRQIGAKMYGAYWCGHCQSQKALFGSAASQIPYIECDARGSNPQPQRCQRAGITGYPTWEIRGRLYTGTRSLESLAQLSGYRGR